MEDVKIEFMRNAQTLIFIPTYNEIENVEIILTQLIALKLKADILFVDDNSPDGTGELLEKLKSSHANLVVEHRAEKNGVGAAHRFAINWAKENGYERLLTMDCDFSHSPEYIPEFLMKSNNADVVVGSRYLKKNSLHEWSIYRKTLTSIGHFLTTFFLALPYDATGAFRVYNLKKININFVNLVRSNSYSFFFESLFILYFNGYSIAEVPINIPARMYGHSKMRIKDIYVSVKLLCRMFFIKIFMPYKFKIKN